MDTLAVLHPPWIPEDDLLLKNAVEGGASLESLAKGAVRFSRRYSVTELEDRWRALLYDPDVSAEAAVSMANLELNKLNGVGIRESSGDGDGDGDRKRKSMSVRRQYYAMRKRFCLQAFDSFDMGLRDEMSIDKSMEIGGGDLNKELNNLLVNNLVDYGNLEDAGVGSSHSMREVVPIWRTLEDVSVPAMPIENENPGSEDLKGKCVNDALNAPSGAMLGDEDTHISDSLLNLTNEDEILLMDMDGKEETVAGHETEKPCYDNVDSLILTSPCDIVQGNDTFYSCQSHKSDMGTKLAMPSGASMAGLDVVNPSSNSRGDQHVVSDLGNEVQSSAASQSSHLEHGEEFMICVLNTEDPDVPCNDRANTSVVVPNSVTLKSQSIVKEVGYPDSSINNQRKMEQDGRSKKEDISSHSLAALQTVRPGLAPNISSSNFPVGVVQKTENPSWKSVSAVSRPSNNIVVNINPGHGRSVHATMMPASDERLKQEEIDAPASAEVYAHTNAEDHRALPKSEARSLPLGQEGGEDDDNDNDDDDSDDDNDDENEIPYFSDAEAMILEMDLSPSDHDINASKEVLRYQHEETKRTFMRLEQCAQSFMRRAIASRGALAVLYGRHLKQYIKKSEVILGRATDDVQVDIDLGREGRANRISRRQALIKLEANGSFVIKNVGKSSIFLNGKEVATGQMRGLNAGNLIEIRDMSFIFEVNNKCVQKFLENVNENREK